MQDWTDLSRILSTVFIVANGFLKKWRRWFRRLATAKMKREVFLSADMTIKGRYCIQSKVLTVEESWATLETD